MKSQTEEVREALDRISIIVEPTELLQGEPLVEVLGRFAIVHNIVKKALVSISEEPEMVKLLRILDDPRDTFSHCSARAAILSVKKYIEEEFGYTLPDEARR